MARRLHIVGAHRSGTTLMLDLFSTCFKVGGCSPDEMSIYDEPDKDYDLFVSKQPRDILVVKSIMAVDPELYVIYMVRDPRAVIASVNRTHPDMYFCNLRVWMECEAAAKELDSHPRFMTVRYEDLVNNADAEQKRIIEKFSFLEQMHPFSEFHKYSNATKAVQNAMNDLRPISPDRVDTWKQHLPRIKGQMQLHPGLEDALIRRGYESDSHWTGILDNIEPQFIQSRSPEYDYLWHKLDWKWRNWVKYCRKRWALICRDRRVRSSGQYSA